MCERTRVFLGFSSTLTWSAKTRQTTAGPRTSEKGEGRAKLNPRVRRAAAKSKAVAARKQPRKSKAEARADEERRRADGLVAERALEYIRGGVPVQVAFQACGVSASAFNDWSERSVEGEEPYAATLRQVGVALAEAEARWALEWQTIGKKDWKSRRDLLKHHPSTRDRWNPSQGDGETAVAEPLPTTIRFVRMT